MLPRSAHCRTTPVRRQSRRGWLLVGLIVLISAVILGLAGITFYLTEHLRTTSLRQNQTRAIYLAQAGVMRALYDYRFDSPGIGGRDMGFNLGQSIVVDGPGTNDDVFFLEAGGGARDFFLVNLKPATLPNAATLCSGSRHRLTGWRLRNVLLDASPTVAIDKVAVNWDPVISGETVISLILGNQQRWPASGCGAMGPEPDPDPPFTNAMDITNLTVSPGGVLTSNTIWFSNTNFRTPVSGGTGTTPKNFIDLKFLMTDGSIRVARFVNTIADRGSNFTVTAAGKVGTAQFPFVSCRRLQTEHEICGAVTAENQCDADKEEQETTGKLTVYRELASQCP